MAIIEQETITDPVVVHITMARAFKARKDLNAMIQRMDRTLRRVRPFVHESELESEKSSLTTGDVEKEIIELEKLLHTKMTLDIAIEQSNVDGQIKLAQIEKCNKTIDLLTHIEEMARGAKNTDRFFNNVTGKYEVEQLSQVLPNVDFFEKPIEKATNCKRELEEELQKLNNETVIPLPIDKTIAGKLGFTVE